MKTLQNIALIMMLVGCFFASITYLAIKNVLFTYMNK